MFNKSDFKISFELIEGKTLIETSMSSKVDCSQAVELLDKILNKGLVEYIVGSIIKAGEKDKASLQAETIVSTLVVNERSKLPQLNRDPMIKPHEVFAEWHRKINEND